MKVLAIWLAVWGHIILRILDEARRSMEAAAYPLNYVLSYSVDHHSAYLYSYRL